MPLRWTEGDHTGQGLRGWWPTTKPADGEGWFVAQVVRYSGSTWRAFFQRSAAGDQPIGCWFTSGEDAMAAVDAHFDAHPELTPGQHRRGDRDWF